MITRKLIQQRPNTGVDFYTPSDEVLTLLNKYTEGDIQISVSADNLTKTISFTVSEENHTLLGDNEILNNAKIDRETYCNDNSITFEIVET